MAWSRIGNKPLSELMLTRFTDAYMRDELLLESGDKRIVSMWGNEAVFASDG